MGIEQDVNNVGGQVVKSATGRFLKSFTNPAFGSMPKKEIELCVVELMKDLGLINRSPSAYELVSKLKISSSKARGLIYEAELRSLDAKALDRMMVAELKSPIVLNNGKGFSLDITSPLLLDHIKNKLKDLGQYSDGSFSPGVVKLTENGFVVLLENALNDYDRLGAVKKLQANGYKGKKLKTLLLGLVNKIKDKAVDGAIGAAGTSLLASLFSS